MDVSIIILNYNCEPLTLAAIRSIREQTSGVEYELIVVDNGSAQGTEALAQEKDIRLVKLPENVGFGRGNNKGVEVAQGKYLLFLNSDILLRTNAIREQAHYLDEHAEVVAAGVNLFNGAGEPCHSFRRRLPSPLDDITLRWNTEFNHTQQPMPVGYIIGADLMVRREAFLEVGGFDADFFLYYEDAELCHRLHSKGALHVLPWAEYTHLESKSQASELSKLRFLLTSRRLYYKKVKPAYQWHLSNALVRLRAYAHLVVDTLRGRADALAYWQLVLKEM